MIVALVEGRVRTKWLLVAALVFTAGCGEAVWNPDLKPSEPLERGTPFAQALAAHGCPDSVQEIDSETFTATWERTQIVAPAPLMAHTQVGSVSYLVRRGKLGGASFSVSSSSFFGIRTGIYAKTLRPYAGMIGLIPVLAIIAAFYFGRWLRDRARPALAPLALVSVLLLGTSWSNERSGVSEQGVAEGSPSAELVNELGAPTRVIHLPGETGAILVYVTRESKHMIVGGSDTASTQAYLVQRGRIIAASPRRSTLQAQYYLFPFFETAEARLHAAIAWSVALATIVLALASRRRAPAVQSPAP